MIQLGLTYRKNGYDYAQAERIGDVAIYAQYSEGKIIAYEVFEVLKQKEWEAFGKVNPAKEAIPSTESWGTNAFTVHSLKAAQEKVEFIQNRINERVSRQENEKMAVFSHV